MEIIRRIFRKRQPLPRRLPTKVHRDAEICLICSNLRGEQLTRANETPLAFAQLRKSARSCCTCNLLMTGIMHCVPSIHDARSVWVIPVKAPYRADHTGPPLRLRVGGQLPGGRFIETVEFFTPRAQSSPWPRIGKGFTIPGDTSSLYCLRQAEQWMTTCRESHRMCRGKAPSSLPRRVVEIFSFRDSHPRVKLFESHGEREHYMCLSHCWGNGRHLKTTTESLEIHKVEIPWSDLPKTFQDAVIFTRNLGFRYLWIDSLCILQDNPKDWKEESAKMCEVYGNAFLTLFATKARSGNDGLFGSHMRNERHHRLFGTDPITKKPYIVYARCITRMSHFYDDFSLKTLQRDLPLLTRGWVYQERLMSPRVLHFGELEISWECSEETMCQCSGDECISRNDNAPKRSSINNLITGMPSGYDLESIWHVIVTEYSRLMLTYSSDRLAALAGLASRMQQFRNGRYLAGLWEDSIISDLCWHSSPPTNRSDYVVPTWSWAAVISRVNFFTETLPDTASHLNLSLAKYVNISFDLPPGDCFNSISQIPKSITLEGFLDMAEITNAYGRYELEFLHLGVSTRVTSAIEVGDRGYNLYVDEDLQLSRSDSFPVHCMRIAEYHNGDTSKRAYLLLSFVSESDMFKRVGFFIWWVKSQLPPWNGGSTHPIHVTIQ